MAIEQGEETKTYTISERTWRINIETPYGQEPVVTAYRERVQVSGDEVIKTPAPTVTRRLSEVAAQSLPLGTGVAVAQGIADIIDIWRTEDGEV